MARAAVGPAERLLTMFGRQKMCAAVYTAAFMCNLVGCFALVPQFGVQGAAVSTTAALLLESGALFLLTRRQLARGTVVSV